MRPAISFFAQGIPKGQPRAKACIRGKHASVYDPGTAEEWKSIVRHEAKAAWDGVQFGGMIAVSLMFWFPRPKSHYNSKGLKITAPRLHTSRPDADNLAKAVLDALTNLGVWRDDSQVAVLLICKYYSNTEVCGADVAVKEEE